MEKVRRFYLLILIMLCNIIIGQSKHYSKEEKEAFLVGMFRQGGSIYLPTHPIEKNRLTRFCGIADLKKYEIRQDSIYVIRNQRKLKFFIDTLNQYSLESNFKYEIKKLEDRDCIDFYFLGNYNPFKPYFVMSRNKDDYWYSDDGNDDTDYILYSLDLNKKKLKDKKLKLAFLLGAFVNCGEVNTNSQYLYRSPKSKYIDFIIEQLKDLKIKTIKIKRFNEISGEIVIGGSDSVIFIPSGELKDVLEKNRGLWEQNIIKESISIKEDSPFELLDIKKQ